MPDNGSMGEETARFQAFKDRNDDLPPAWQMKAPGGRIGVLAAVVVVVAILAMVVGKLIAG